LRKFGSLKAVIWDMDGVIVDSGPYHFDSWQNTLNQYSLKVSVTELRRMFGMTSPEVVKILFGDEVTDEFVAQLCEEKELLFREAMQENAQYIPGVEYWLNEFKRSGIRQAIASSGSQENIDAVLDILGTRFYLDAIVSGKEMPSKPDPGIFIMAAHHLGVEPKNCLVIEDAIAGVAGAKSAGMKCLAVTTTNGEEDLKNADLILKNLESLSVSIVNSLFS
jgi:beta-phosphoglucomutase